MGEDEAGKSELSRILGFIATKKRARWEELFAKPGGRRRLLDALWDGRDVDSCAIERIVPAHANRSGVRAILRELGAPAEALVLSVRPHLDGLEAQLEAALEEVVGKAPGTVVVCVPGELAYYEFDEKNGRALLLGPVFRRRHGRAIEELRRAGLLKGGGG